MGYVFAKNDEISLIMPDWHEGEEELFEIVLNDTLEVVGDLYYYNEVDKVSGNVEYSVFEEYRGFGYAKKALVLFAENIFKRDKVDLFISILPDNIASIKTAQNAGAVFERMVSIPRKYKFSKDGKYNMALMFKIENNSKEKTIEKK